jgi:Protein of unknown function (DUF2637)
MRELAAAHGETGWQAHTFPLSVDGIEIVASLVLLADRRTGRSPGWLPWAALAAGTTASLAANVAAAGADLVGRVVAGWPAFALLVAVKLLSQCSNPAASLTIPPPLVLVPSPPTTVPELVSRLGTASTRPWVPSPSRPSPPRTGTMPHPAWPVGTPSPAGPRRSAAVAIQRQAQSTPPAPGTERGDGPVLARPLTGTAPDIAGLLPAARTARDRLLAHGDTLTRDTLAAQLRRDGHPLRNAKVSRLLTALRHEAHEHRAARRPAPGAVAAGPVLTAAMDL